MKCQKCGKEIKEEFTFCQHCGSPISHTQEFIIVTTPSIPGFKIKKVLGVITGLTPRTRGVLGKFVASFQTMLGGEVTAFTTELEKARIEAIERIKLELWVPTQLLDLTWKHQI